MGRVGYDPDTLLIGVMGRPHGLSGELTLRPHNELGTDLHGVTAMILDRAGARREWPVKSVRRTGSGWLVRLAGVTSRDDAAPLVNAAVRVRRADLPALAPGEFYVEDVIGCAVVTEDGRALGVVDSVFWNGAQDVMVIRHGEVEHLVPVVADVVRSADPATARVVVAWDAENV